MRFMMLYEIDDSLLEKGMTPEQARVELMQEMEPIFHEAPSGIKITLEILPENEPPPQRDQIVSVLEKEIATLQTSYPEADGIIRDVTIIDEIAHLKAAINIVRFSKEASAGASAGKKLNTRKRGSTRKQTP